MLLTTFPKLYFTSPWLFCSCQFVLLNPFTFFTQSPTLLLSGNQKILLCRIYLCFVCSCILFILFFRFHIDVKSYSTCLFLCDLLHLAHYPLGPSMLSQMVRFHSFLWSSDIPLYNISISSLLYPLVFWLQYLIHLHLN